MAKKKRTPRLAQIRVVGPFKTWEEVEREANKALKELGNIDIVSTNQLANSKLGKLLVITYKPQITRKEISTATSTEKPDPACSSPAQVF